MKHPSMWIFVLPFVCVAILAGVSINVWQSVVVKQFEDQQSQLVNRASALLSQELSYINQIVDFLRVELEVLPPGAFNNQDAWRHVVETKLISAHRLSSNISQLRWITLTGQEAARVNVDNGRVEVVNAKQLQDKSNRYYFIKGRRAPYGDIAFTPIDLNVEHGLIEEPYVVTVRATTKLQDVHGNILGLLVLNFDLNDVFAQIRDLQTDQSTLELLDGEGNWLLSSNAELEWLHLYGDYTASLSHTAPQAWQQIKNGSSLSNFVIGGVPSVARIASSEDMDDVFPEKYMLSRVRTDVWKDERYAIYITVALVSVLLYFAVVSSCWLRWRLSEQQRKYIKKVKRDKARVESAHASLIESNRNLVLLQQELVEQSKLSALGMLVAGVGHELNTPLGGLRMTLSSIAHAQKRIGKSPDSLPEPVSRANQAIKDTLLIAEQNLDRAFSVVEQFKRITDNRTQQTLQHFKVSQILEDTLAALKPLRKQYPNITITHRGESELEFYSVAGVISQVLQSLIVNAFDHAFPSGQHGNLTITFSKEEHYVITVSDDGVGLDQSIMSTIWEPFVTTGRGGHHTGLGLFMVHQWVTQLLHGKIKAENNPAGGAMFTVFIPIHVE